MIWASRYKTHLDYNNCLVFDIVVLINAMISSSIHTMIKIHS